MEEILALPLGRTGQGRMTSASETRFLDSVGKYKFDSCISMSRRWMEHEKFEQIDSVSRSDRGFLRFFRVMIRLWPW